MRKNYKIISIALIFMIIGAGLCPDASYSIGNNLRVPIRMDPDRAKLAAIYASANETARRSIETFEPRREILGGKNAWDEKLEELAKKIGFNTVPGVVRLEISEVWSKFIKANKKLVEEGNKLIAEDDKVTNTFFLLKEIMMSPDFQFPPELEKFIISKTAHIKGQVVVRSSGRWEDSFIRNLAGIFISPRKRNELYIAQAVKEMFFHAMKTMWIRQNDSLKHPIEGIPNKLTEQDGLGILIEPFLDFEASGVAVSEYRGYTCIETVIGDIETAVKPAYANNTYFRFKKGGSEFEHIIPFLKMPYEFKLKGIRYCADSMDGRFRIFKKMQKYPTINEKFSPITKEQAVEVNRVVNELEKELGFSIDVEWGYSGGKLYIVQVRPVINYKKEELVKISPELEAKKPFIETPIARGDAGSNGFTGRVVLFTKSASRKTIKNFEKAFKYPYVRVQDDVALKVSDNPTSAKVLVDVNQGAFNAHGIDAITHRIGKDFAYTNGPVLRKGFEKNLKFIPLFNYDGICDAWISQETVTYFSDGIKGSFYLADKEAPQEEKTSEWQKTLEEFHDRFNDFLEHPEPYPDKAIDKLCDIVMETIFQGNANKKVDRLIFEVIEASYYHEGVHLDYLKRMIEKNKLRLNALEEKDYESIQPNIEQLKEALSYPLYPNAFESYYVMTLRCLLLLEGAEKIVQEIGKKKDKEALAEKKAFEDEYLEGRKILPDKYRVVLINAHDIEGNLNARWLEQYFGADTCIDIHTTEVQEIREALEKVNYDVAYFYAHIYGMDTREIIDELEKIRKKNPDAKIAIDHGMSPSIDFEIFGDIFLGEGALLIENPVLEKIVSGYKEWQDIKKKLEGKGKFQILACDDDEDILKNIEEGLNFFMPGEFQLTCVESAEKAKEELQKSEFDLAIYDLRVDGFDFEFEKLLALKARDKILSTGFNEEVASKKIILSINKENYLRKPWDISMLSGLIGRIKEEKKIREMPSAKKNIFIISNDPKENSLLIAFVESMYDDCRAFNIDSVDNLKTKLEEKTPDFVITDSHIPGQEDIKEILGLIKDKNAGAKFIITSENAVELRSMSFEDFNILSIVEKPFYSQGVFKALKDAISIEPLIKKPPVETQSGV